MTRLRLELLGPMQVILIEQPIITFPYEKVKALLAYLATESNYPHHRNTLAAMRLSVDAMPMPPHTVPMQCHAIALSANAMSM